jgi:IS30 family transposase
MAHSHFNRKRNFSHLSAFDRGQIQALRNQGKTLQDIADIIGYHKSTVSRELKRGTTTQRKTDLSEYQAYFPETGQAAYESNRTKCGAKYKLIQSSEFIDFAIDKLQKGHWSPDAICGYAKENKLFQGEMVSTKTLYNYIDLGLLPVKNIDLPLKTKRSTKQKRVRKNKRLLGKSIEQRPPHIDERNEFGHWEIDTVLGNRKKGAVLLTLTERKTRAEIITKISQKSVLEVHLAIQKIKEMYGEKFPLIFKTITSDNGTEFSELETAVQNKSTEIYYTHPYTSSERGTNERHNGLIRRFIPKGKSIDDINSDFINYVQNWCNTLPRKILGYRTPRDRFLEEVKNIA